MPWTIGLPPMTIIFQWISFIWIFVKLSTQSLIVVFFTKLAAYGIRGQLLDWIKSYLTDQQQKVVLNGASSDWSRVYSGVLQGSVLGPLLFNIYVNDIPSVVDSQTLMFADDTKIFRKIQIFSDFNKTLIIYSLGRLAKWQLKFNISKCFIFHLGPDHSYGDYYLDGVQILPNTTVKDLGVILWTVT